MTRINRVTLPTVFIICMALALFCRPPAAGELGFNHLKGLRYIHAGVEFNGILFGETYVDEKEEEFRAFNLDKLMARLAEDKVPVGKEVVEKVYSDMIALLGGTKLKLLKMRLYMEEPSTVVPVLTARVLLRPSGGKGYLGVVHLVLEKWMSNWVGTERILAPAYIWSDKVVFLAPGDTLSETVQAGVTELMKIFIDELTEANRPEISPEEEEGAGGEKKE